MYCGNIGTVVVAEVCKMSVRAYFISEGQTSHILTAITGYVVTDGNVYLVMNWTMAIVIIFRHL
jgi:hypothetical protein